MNKTDLFKDDYNDVALLFKRLNLLITFLSLSDPPPNLSFPLHSLSYLSPPGSCRSPTFLLCLFTRAWPQCRMVLTPPTSWWLTDWRHSYLSCPERSGRDLWRSTASCQSTASLWWWDRQTDLQTDSNTDRQGLQRDPFEIGSSKRIIKYKMTRFQTNQKAERPCKSWYAF